MKKLRTLTALIAMLCCCIASAEDFGVCGIYYNILSQEDKTVEVTYRSESAVIPSSVIYNGNTYSVTSIGNNAFNKCDNNPCICNQLLLNILRVISQKYGHNL